MAELKGTKDDPQAYGPDNSTADGNSDREQVTNYDPPDGTGGGWPYGKGKPSGGGRPYPEPPSIEPPDNWR